MRCLSLPQPLAWAIAYAGCDVLKRGDVPPADLATKEFVAIRAGRGWDRHLYEWLRLNALRLGIPPCPDRYKLVHGKVVAVTRVTGCVDVPSDSRWATSAVGWWRLWDTRRLPDPVECERGDGLYEIPHAVEDAVEISLMRRRSCHSCNKARTQRYGPPTCELVTDQTLYDAGGCMAWRPKP